MLTLRRAMLAALLALPAAHAAFAAPSSGAPERQQRPQVQPPAGTDSDTEADPSFILLNATHSDIVSLYSRNSSAGNNWGDDLLGEDAIAFGNSRTFEFNKGDCVRSVKIVFESGAESVSHAINTCEIMVFIIHPNGIQLVAPPPNVNSVPGHPPGPSDNAPQRSVPGARPQPVPSPHVAPAEPRSRLMHDVSLSTL